MPIGLAGAGSSVKQVLLDFVALVQSVAAIIWTPQIYSISAFSLCFGDLDGELDILDYIHET